MTTPDRMAADSLGECFRRHGTDKYDAGLHEMYGRLLGPRRLTIAALLEVGVGTLNPDEPWSMAGHVPAHYRPGGSLRAWRDWLPQAHIIGVDISPDTVFSESRVLTVLADSTDADQLNHRLPGGLFDVIIDDGNHSLSAQTATMTNLWPRLAAGGFYVVEDRKRADAHLGAFEAIAGRVALMVYGSAIVFRKALAE